MGTHTSPEDVGTKPSVLVVDDETGPRDALKVILRPFFTIHSADNAKSALRVLKDQHIDLSPSIKNCLTARESICCKTSSRTMPTSKSSSLPAMAA